MKNQLENIKSWTAKYHNYLIAILLFHMFILQVVIIATPPVEVIKEVEKPVEVIKEKIVEVDKSDEKLTELDREFKAYKVATRELIEIDGQGFVIASQMVGVMGEAIKHAYNRDADGLQDSTDRLKPLTDKLGDLKTQREAVIILLGK